jgi:hypothetical protein
MKFDKLVNRVQQGRKKFQSIFFFFLGRKSRTLSRKGAAETAASQEFGTCLLHGSLPLLYTLYLSFECVRE